MSPELKDNLERQLYSAKESGDSKRIIEAMCNMATALIDCQMKTATRVKQEHAAVFELKQDMATKFDEVRSENREFKSDINEKFDSLKDDIRSMKDKGSGAMAVIQTMLKIAALGGGSVTVAGIAKAFGIL